MKFLVAAIGILIIFVGSVFSQTETENADTKKKFFYEWTDKQGIVHITDNFGKVPHQYQPTARKIESRRPESRDQEQGETELQLPPISEGGDADALGQAQWRGRIREWENRLLDAQKRYNELETQRDELLRQWGSAALAPSENKLKAEQIDEQMNTIRTEIDEAQNMIQHVIPEEARKAGVPPGWLRE